MAATDASTRRCAVVTGGSRGIGRASAIALAREGFDIGILYAGNAEAAQETVALIEAEGVRARAWRCDVSDADEVTRTVDEVLEAFGAVWVLVNNAGITRDGLLARMREEDFCRVIDTNLKGAYHMIRALARTFMRQRGGRIIQMSSVVGLSGNVGQANYAASKAGIIGLTKAVARELAGRGVTVNAIAPGFVETAMTAVLDEGTRERIQREIPLGRMAAPEEVAALVAFLARDEAAYITGEIIRVDGGMSM